MKKGDVIGLNNMIINIQSNFDQKEIAPFKYAFVKNIFRFKSVLEERDAIIKEILKEFTGDPNTEEGVKDINKLIEDSSMFKTFLDEEVDIDLYTVNVDKLENQEFNSEVATALISKNIIVE